MERWQPINIDSLSVSEVIEIKPFQAPIATTNPEAAVSEPFESHISTPYCPRRPIFGYTNSKGCANRAK